MVRDNPTRQAGEDGALEARLRALFRAEIETQGSLVADRNIILLMARIDALNKRQATVASIESGSEILALGTIVALLAVWWKDLASGLEALFPIAASGFSWEAGIGVGTSLAALLILWYKALVRDV